MIKNMTEFVYSTINKHLGGEGSGYFGHSGRPGEVGGSSSEGGAGVGRGHFAVKEELPYEERQDLVMKDTGWDREKAVDTVKAVNHFTLLGYSNIRAAQAGDLQFDVGYKKEGVLIEEYIAKSPRFNEPVYRGLRATGESNLTKFAEVKEGDVVDMKGTSSWTSSEERGQKYAFNGVLFRAKSIKKGTSIKHLSSFPSEDEVLVSKDAKFRIVGKEWIRQPVGKVLALDVEEV